LAIFSFVVLEHPCMLPGPVKISRKYLALQGAAISIFTGK
jgi:hypothetical protein